MGVETHDYTAPPLCHHPEDPMIIHFLNQGKPHSQSPLSSCCSVDATSVEGPAMQQSVDGHVQSYPGLSMSEPGLQNGSAWIYQLKAAALPSFPFWSFLHLCLRSHAQAVHHSFCAHGIKLDWIGLNWNALELYTSMELKQTQRTIPSFTLKRMSGQLSPSSLASLSYCAFLQEKALSIRLSLSCLALLLVL